MITRAVCVMIGGGLGAYLRYLVQHALQWRAEPIFPWGTLVVNVSGAFLMGVLMTEYMDHFKANPEWRLFLIVGILGGFTTFSSLMWEIFELFNGGHLMQGSLYILGTALGGALALISGIFIGRLI